MHICATALSLLAIHAAPAAARQPVLDNPKIQIAYEGATTPGSRFRELRAHGGRRVLEAFKQFMAP
jgi:hypothetical protein